MDKEGMIKAGYYGAFGDCYRLLQRFCDVSDKTEYWVEVARAASAISRKYDGTMASVIVNKLLTLVYDELARRLEFQTKEGIPDVTSEG